VAGEAAAATGAICSRSAGQTRQLAGHGSSSSSSGTREGIRMLLVAAAGMCTGMAGKITTKITTLAMKFTVMLRKKKMTMQNMLVTTYGAQ
jgi:hypothetical protein